MPRVGWPFILFVILGELGPSHPYNKECKKAGLNRSNRPMLIESNDIELPNNHWQIHLKHIIWCAVEQGEIGEVVDA